MSVRYVTVLNGAAAEAATPFFSRLRLGDGNPGANGCRGNFMLRTDSSGSGHMCLRDVFLCDVFFNKALRGVCLPTTALAKS